MKSMLQSIIVHVIVIAVLITFLLIAFVIYIGINIISLFKSPPGYKIALPEQDYLAYGFPYLLANKNFVKVMISKNFNIDMSNVYEYLRYYYINVFFSVSTEKGEIQDEEFKKLVMFKTCSAKLVDEDRILYGLCVHTDKSCGEGRLDSLQYKNLVLIETCDKERRCCLENIINGVYYSGDNMLSMCGDIGLCETKCSTGRFHIKRFDKDCEEKDKKCCYPFYREIPKKYLRIPIFYRWYKGYLNIIFTDIIKIIEFSEFDLQ